MSVATEISKLNTNLLNAYTEIGNKGGTIPTNKNTDNLATAISSIPAGSAGVTDSSILITDYDVTTGKITGQNFGDSGKVYLLDRDTHTYNELTTSNYSNSSITLTSPINRSMIQGNTCFFVQPTDKGISNKFMVYGDGTLTVPQWGIIYVQDESTRQITKVICTSSTDLGKLRGANNMFGESITVNGNTFFKSQIVGFQFGDGVTSYSVPTLFLAQLLNLNQPIVFTDKVTLSTSSTYLFRYDYMFDCPIVFTNQNRVGNYFMTSCETFNQPLDISMFEFMNATYFMQNCATFNQELKLPSALGTTKTIGNYFLYNCSSFNKELNLPTNITGLGNYFMSGCSTFNSPIIWGNTFTTTGTYFMRDCSSFNQPLNFPSGITSIPTYFMSGCSSFNSKLSFAGVLRTINTNFLSNTAFNQEIDFLGSVATIGNNFMSQCHAFNKELVLGNNLTSIGTTFMSYCQSFNHKLVIPSSVTSVGTGFMQNCVSFGELEVNTTASPTDANTLSHTYSTCRLYEGGVKLTGTGASTWKTNLPDSTTNPYRKLILG